jgi:hypothetical protein
VLSEAACVGILGHNTGIVHMNHAAAKILAEHDGLIATEGWLDAESGSESARLQDLIAQAWDTSIGTGLRPAGAIAISRRLRPPLQVLITPVRSVSLDSTCPVHAIAFVTDPSQRARPAADVLRTLFGLTPFGMPGVTACNCTSGWLPMKSRRVAAGELKNPT